MQLIGRTSPLAAGRRGPPAPVALLAAVLAVSVLRSQDVDRILQIVRSIPQTALEEPTLAEAGAEASSGSLRDAGEEEAEAFVPVLHLTNGNVLRGRVLNKFVPVETPFGTLNIPVAEIVDARFHSELSPDQAAVIAAAIKRLGDDDFEVREAAATELARLAPSSIPALREALNARDEEIRRRAESLLATAESAISLREDQLDPPLLDGLDRIRTRRSTAQGLVSLDFLELETRYGRLRVPRAELQRVVFRVEASQTFKLSIPDSASVPSSWLQTRARVKKGDRLKIEASGQMSNPPYSYTAGPDGYNRSSRTLPPFKILSLVGRIGRTGKPFIVGSRYDQPAAASGVLYLGVVPYRYGSLQGSYRASIRVR